jgi:hypothetical protein
MFFIWEERCTVVFFAETPKRVQILILSKCRSEQAFDPREANGLEFEIGKEITVRFQNIIYLFNRYLPNTYYAAGTHLE